MRLCVSCCCTLAVAAVLALCGSARAAETITLRNGFAITCDHREGLSGGGVRLYLNAGSTSYMDVPLETIVSTEAAAVPSAAVEKATLASSHGSAVGLSVDSLIQITSQARKLNVDLLRSVVNAESGGQVHAVSRAGAQGLMQLMPATARLLGVTDSFAPEQNLRGGTDYLDSLLRRYHDDLALALAAYNAGPAAVDRYHGVPPYRETKLYVARIIREFNRRTLLAQRGTTATAGVAAAQ